MDEMIQAKVTMKFKGMTQKDWNNPSKEQLLLIVDQLKDRIRSGEKIEHFEIIREVGLVNLTREEKSCTCFMKNTDSSQSQRKRRRLRDRS